MTQFELLQNGIGRSLGFLGRAGYMVSVTLLSRTEGAPDYQAQIDTMTSVAFQGTEYTSSCEIDDDAPYGVCEFDKKVAAIMSDKERFSLKRIFYDDAYCLHLLFNNGLEIHSHAVAEQGAELWRIFLSWTADIHLIGYPERVVEEAPELSQQELDERKRLLYKRMADRVTRGAAETKSVDIRQGD